MNTRRLNGTLVVMSFLASTLAVAVGACTLKPGGETTRRGARRPAPQSATYTIKFDRPFLVGYKFHLRVDRVEHARKTISGVAVARKKRVDYRAFVTVGAVNQRGQPTKQEHKVIACDLYRKGSAKKLIAHGDVVVAEIKDGRQTFSINGKPVSEEVAKVLEIVVEMRIDNAPSRDDIFGTNEPRRPGDSWKINVTRLLSSLRHKIKKATVFPKPTDVKGLVTFVGTRKLYGLDDVLDIKVNAAINNICPDMGRLKGISGTATLEMRGWIPKDIQSHASSMRVKTTRKVEAEETNDGKTDTIVTNVTTHTYRRIIPLPSGGFEYGGR